MGSGCRHEVDIAHIEGRGHHRHLWDYLSKRLFLTPDCIRKVLSALLGEEAARNAVTFGENVYGGRYVVCIGVGSVGRWVGVRLVVEKTERCLRTRSAYPDPGCEPAYCVVVSDLCGVNLR
ncbi:hypothetical protein [Pyrobaculum neutrophilum]|uniref:Uncharacterized protein n=1 Tax=Pyrobaculum neutrophilum (strain DSM 2338 / JCM 9278 / NBRC 100436 / V24Sta) TaxID=444157 RepID=B1YDV3_PYRNV|nr:hypothetical protein [Pyrobaculum neutrophilum]ACB39966.1 hypothetical protein Tneu_1035 [Pyrobaculum neutrophilum V24Sta]